MSQSEVASGEGELRESTTEKAPVSAPALGEENLRVVRIGHGANCSSVGSVIDTLFLGATVGGAIFAALCAAMKVEGVTVVGDADDSDADDGDEEGAP